MPFFHKFNSLALIITVALAALAAHFFWEIAAGRAYPHLREYFFAAGSGESELVMFPSGVKVLVDAGPADAAAVLKDILPRGDRYIDIAVISFRNVDYFGGFTDLLGQYDVGAFAWSGREDGSAADSWEKLRAVIKKKHIPMVALDAGDRIRAGEDKIDILSPADGFLESADPKEAAIVARVDAGGIRTLLAGAAGASVEQYLMSERADLGAEILQTTGREVHGAVAAAFWQAADPAVAVISAETPGIQGALFSARRIFRTNENGTVSIAVGESDADGAAKLRIVTQK